MRTSLNRTVGASAATVVALGLSCCARQPEQAQHTVAEYRANADLRREQFARCANDLGTLGKTPDCVNAQQAQRLEDIGSVRDTSPIQLPRPGSKK
jgi:hypothetical protein